jgi:hypothetical protein
MQKAVNKKTNEKLSEKVVAKSSSKDKKKTDKKGEDKEAPKVKRNQNAYMFFAGTMRSKIKSENPNFKAKEIVCVNIILI